MLDPISDMLTRIRNANLAGHEDVLIPFSKFKRQIAEIIGKKNFVRKTEEEETAGKKFLRITLKYMEDAQGKKKPFIQGLRRISREGQRIYAKKENLPVVKSGFGFSIVSTPKGLMTNEEARKEGHGGEIICEIW